MLVFGYPEAPFAQPANVIGGHVICTLVGLALLYLCGGHACRLRLPWSGVLVLVLIAFLYSNAVRKATYPHYW